MIEIKANIEKISIGDIAGVEEKAGYSLPQDYIDFLLSSNGGKPEQNLLKVPVYGPVRIDIFCGINLEKEQNTIKRYMEFYQGRIPAGFLAIAATGCSNLLCISLSEEKGSIYFWDHDFEADDGDIPDMSNMYRVSNSFSELLEKIEKFPQ